MTSNFLKYVSSMEVFLLILFTGLFLVSCSREQAFREAPRSGPDVAVEVKSLAPDVPAFFTYHYRGKKTNFFVMKVDNRVLSFLGACARCYPAKRGFRYEGGSIICRECNVRYSVSQIEKGIGSCFPVRVEGSLRDGKYLIPISVLEGMADKF
jgi:uncharacterized membrane protein